MKKRRVFTLWLILVLGVPCGLLASGLLRYSTSFTSMGSDKAVFLTISAKSARAGDVVCFSVPEGRYPVLDVLDWGTGKWVISEGSFQGQSTVHRVLGCNLTYRDWRVEYYLTRGDNNTEPDPFTWPRDALPYERIAPAYGVKPEWIKCRVLLILPIGLPVASVLWAVLVSTILVGQRTVDVATRVHRRLGQK